MGKASARTALAAAMIITTLAGCQRFADHFGTGVDGYVKKCVDGTEYLVLATEYSMAITPHLGTDGKPRGCK